MSTQKITREFTSVVEAAGNLAVAIQADAILFLLDGSTDWERLRELIPAEVQRVLVSG
jgi:hypothetical protein